MQMDMNDYEKIIRIRAFEEYVLEMFSKGQISGTTHTYIGQEATAVAAFSFVRPQDKVFSNHRCHGHYLAYGGPERMLLAEIMSRETGMCEGRGGSQHIHFRNFYTNGVQGGIVPNAVGMALAEKHMGHDSNAVVFLGDGTLGQGVVYESVNIAAIYNAPVMFVIEDNQYAMSSKRSDMLAGDIRERISAYDIHTVEIESTDIGELKTFFGEVFSYLNDMRRPACAIVHNYRLGAHSKGDDTRDINEIGYHREKDPVRSIISAIGEEEYTRLYNGCREYLERLTEEIKTEGYVNITAQCDRKYKYADTMLCHKDERVVDGIVRSFEDALSEDDRVILMGEDIRDPYGGAFKCTKGLTEKFDSRVWNMPISEAAMVGIAVGMAMCGLLPVVEMMFGDFITLGFDQLLNHAVKYHYVYGEGVTIPMIVRVPSGAKRGYGPTHSQSLEKFLVGIPQLHVIALSRFHDPRKMYEALFHTVSEPTIVVENKKLYAEKCNISEDGECGIFEVEEYDSTGYSTISLYADKDSEPDCYLITYGGMAEDAAEAAEKLMMDDEIAVRLIIMGQLSPLPIEDIVKIVKTDAPVVTVEEGTGTGGIGAEIIAQCIERGIYNKFYRIASPDMPIPNGIELERQVIPDAERIIREIHMVLEE